MIPRNAKIPQTVAENATLGMSRTFVWRGEKSPCENTEKVTIDGFSHCAFSRFRPDNTLTRLHDMAQTSHHDGA